MILVGLRLACWLISIQKPGLHLLICVGNVSNKHSEVGFAAVFFKGMLSFGYFPRPTFLGVQLPGICEGSDHLHFGAKKNLQKRRQQKLHIQNIRVVWGTQVGLEEIPSHGQKKTTSYFPLSHILVV